MMLKLLSVEKLGSCFIKVEDEKRHHCPLYKSFSALPAVHISRPFGISVFAPSADDEQKQIQTQLQPSTKQLLHRYTVSVVSF